MATIFYLQHLRAAPALQWNQYFAQPKQSVYVPCADPRQEIACRLMLLFRINCPIVYWMSLEGNVEKEKLYARGKINNIFRAQIKPSIFTPSLPILHLFFY